MRKGFLLLSYCALSSLIVSCAGLDSSSTDSLSSSSSDSSSSVLSSATSSTSSNISSTNSSSSQDLLNFTLTVSGKGTVSGSQSGQYLYGETISLTAVPDDGYFFSGYYANDVLLTDEASYSFALVADTAITALFSANTQSYYHKFELEDFTTNLPFTYSSSSYYNNVEDYEGQTFTTDSINGLQWNYELPTYLGYRNSMVQLGSNKHPQQTDWTISATFPSNVKINSYELVVENDATNAPATYGVSFGNHEESGSFGNGSLQSFSEANLDVTANTFSVSLKSASKSIYLYSIAMTVTVPEDSDIDLSEDVLEERDPATPGENGIPDIRYPLVSKEDYYKDTDLTLSGSELVNELNVLISANTSQPTYGDDSNILCYTDEDLDNPGYIYSTWTGDVIKGDWDGGGSWNKEHVWPKSLLMGHGDVGDSESGIATDLHNLRVADSASNSYHGNDFYGDGTNGTFYPNIAAGTLPGNHVYEGDFRGDTARILFYMYVRYYPDLDLITGYSATDDHSLGDLTYLLDWNTEDPVDEFEVQRNNRIFEYQGNRNPFIDYPDLATEIWG